MLCLAENISLADPLVYIFVQAPIAVPGFASDDLRVQRYCFYRLLIPFETARFTADFNEDMF